MGRTIRRTPLTVNTNPGIKYEFFNHSNWNGLCDDKNYLNVNQETFEDCNNVYVDENNLLKSRPSLKVATEITEGGIVNIWKFDDITCWLVDEHYVSLIISDGNKRLSHYVYSLNTKVFKYGDKIFVLDDKHIWYIDDNLELVKADDYLYAPIRYTYANGVRSEDVVETDNLLTNKYRERYIYNKIDKITNPTYYNKNIVINYDGENVKYSNFQRGQEDLLFFEQFSVTSDNYFDGRLLLDVSDNGNMILSTYSVIPGDEGSYIRFDIRHSIDGKTFTQINPPAGKTYGYPIISRDGTFVIVFKEDGPYALSLIPDTSTGAMTFSVWTNLLDYNGIKLDDFHISNIYANGFYSINMAVNGQFLNTNTFAMVFRESTGFTRFTLINQSNIEVDKIETRYSFLNYTPFVKITVTDKIHLLAMTTRNVDDVNDELCVYDLYKDGPFNNSGKKFNYGYLEPLNYDVLLVEDDILRVAVKDAIYEAKIGYDFNLIKSISNFNNVYSKFTNNGNVITEYEYFIAPTYEQHVRTPSYILDVFVVNNTIWMSDESDLVYNNYIGDNFVTVDVLYDGETTPMIFDDETELNEKYWSKNNTLYISLTKFNDANEKLLYFPKINNQKFDEQITNLHAISESQVAIFFDNQIWYSQITEQGYAYHKSKLQVGLAKGADVITSPDGKNIIFPTERGLVYLGYQELVQSSEQTLTFLSDTIQTHWKNFVTKPVKLLLYKYWLYCYNENEKVLYVFDIRNNSWWKWTIPDGVIKIKQLEIPIIIVNKFAGMIVKLDDSYTDYFDYDNSLIDWHITSQKLHLGTLNYYKNVHSIIINNVEYEDIKHDVSYNLDIKNYRITSSYRYEEPKNFTYKVDMLRTFVKRCNSRKLNEFQYTLSSDTGDNADVIQLPLSIHSIIIKYTVSGQVR